MLTVTLRKLPPPEPVITGVTLKPRFKVFSSMDAVEPGTEHPYLHPFRVCTDADLTELMNHKLVARLAFCEDGTIRCLGKKGEYRPVIPNPVRAQHGLNPGLYSIDRLNAAQHGWRFDDEG